MSAPREAIRTLNFACGIFGAAFAIAHGAEIFPWNFPICFCCGVCIGSYLAED